MTELFLTFAAVLLFLFARWKLRYRYPPDDVPRVLCYHKLSDRFCFEGTWMQPGRFRGQIEFLIEKGYRFIGQAEYFASLERRSPENARKILLTFDDGYEELYDMFVDYLEPRGIPVLVFLVSEFAGRENTWELSLGRRPFRHLSWDQVREMSKRGADFGAHGATHADVTRAAPGTLLRETAASRESISRETGRDVIAFSYPYGRSDRRAKRAVEAAGYTGAFSLYPAHTNAYADWFCLRRNGVYIIDTRLSLLLKLERSPLFWFEEMKCRTINALAVLTPLLKRTTPGARDRGT